MLIDELDKSHDVGDILALVEGVYNNNDGMGMALQLAERSDEERLELLVKAFLYDVFVLPHAIQDCVLHFRDQALPQLPSEGTNELIVGRIVTPSEVKDGAGPLGRPHVGNRRCDRRLPMSCHSANPENTLR